MEVQVDWLGVVVASAAAMAIGSLWYSNLLFGKTWQKLVGLKDKDMKAGAAPAMIKAVVLSLLTAYVFTHIIYITQTFYGYSFIQTGIITSFCIWIGFVGPFTILNAVFEQRDSKLTLLNISNQLVTLLAMGAILGAFLS